MEKSKSEKTLVKNLGHDIQNYNEFIDGWSFTVCSELQAYKTAYYYQGCGRITIKQASSGPAWHVSMKLDGSSLVFHKERLRLESLTFA